MNSYYNAGRGQPGTLPMVSRGFAPVPLPQGRSVMMAAGRGAVRNGDTRRNGDAPYMEEETVSEAEAMTPGAHFLAMAISPYAIAGAIAGYLVNRKASGALVGFGLGLGFKHWHMTRELIDYQMPDGSTYAGMNYGDACSRWERKYTKYAEKYEKKGKSKHQRWAEKNRGKAVAAGCDWAQSDDVQQLLQGGAIDTSLYQVQGYDAAMAAEGSTNSLSPLLLVGGIGALAIVATFLITR